MKACYFGDFRLWREARKPTASHVRGFPPQTHLGVDQAQAAVIGNSENIATRVEVTTFGRPHPSYYTQEAWTAVKRKISTGLNARASRAHPLCWIADTTPGGVLTMGGGQILTFGVAHNLVAGDRVLVRRSGVGLYAIRTVQMVITSLQVGLTTGLSPYLAMAGDNVFRISSLWDPLYFAGMPPVPAQGGAKGDYYAPELMFAFEGAPTTEWDRITVDLDT